MLRTIARLTLLLTLVAAAGTASAQPSVRVDELTSFKYPFEVVAGQIIQLADGRTFGFFSGGYNGAIYQVVPNGSGGYETQVVYEFPRSMSGPPNPYSLNSAMAPVVQRAADGWIYFAGKSLTRWNPDTNVAEDLHAFDYNGQPVEVSVSNDGLTLYGVHSNGHVWAWDTVAATFRDVTQVESFSVLGLLVTKNNRLLVSINDFNNLRIVVRRIDPATGNAPIVLSAGRSSASPPAKGSDGDIYMQWNIFGDQHTYRYDDNCLCLTDLKFVPYPNNLRSSSITGPRNGYLYINSIFTPHRLNLATHALEQLSTEKVDVMRLLPDGKLVLFGLDAHLVHVLNTDTAVPGATPIVNFVDAPANDGLDGYPYAYTEGADGALYGITNTSFSTGYLSIYRIDPHTGVRSIPARFPDNCASNCYYGTYTTTMVRTADGMLYGTYSTGDHDAIFRFNPSTGAVDELRRFGFQPDGTFPDGLYPLQMMVGHDGALHGVMFAAAPDGQSGLFRLDPQSGDFSLMVPDIGELYGPVFESSPGVFLTTQNKYVDDICGAVARVDTNAGTGAVLADLHGPVEGCPYGPVQMAPAADGSVFFTTTVGGSGTIDDYYYVGKGALLKIDPGTGAVTKVHQFQFDEPVSGPVDVLIAGADGYLYSQMYSNTFGDYSHFDTGLMRFDPVTGAATALYIVPDQGSAGPIMIASDGRVFMSLYDRVLSIAVVDPPVVAPASGPYGGTTSVSATLKAIGVPLAGRTISFTLNGASVGSATTDANGVATLDHVSLGGIAIGAYATAIGASFAGDSEFPAAAGSGSLTVIDVPTPGLMIGGGIVKGADVKYPFAFFVRENATGGDRGGFELMRIGKKGKTDRFVAQALTNVVFSDDPSILPGRQPRPQVDTVLFSGPGQWNGQDGYRFEAFAQDRGEPGRHRESLRVTIYDGSDHIVVTFDQDIDGGNIQSNRLRQ